MALTKSNIEVTVVIDGIPLKYLCTPAEAELFQKAEKLINSEIESRVADETNRRLRKKLTAAGADVYIQTVWGYGFKLTRISEQ